MFLRSSTFLNSAIDVWLIVVCIRRPRASRPLSFWSSLMIDEATTGRGASAAVCAFLRHKAHWLRQRVKTVCSELVAGHMRHGDAPKLSLIPICCYRPPTSGWRSNERRRIACPWYQAHLRPGPINIYMYTYFSRLSVMKFATSEGITPAETFALCRNWPVSLTWWRHGSLERRSCAAYTVISIELHVQLGFPAEKKYLAEQVCLIIVAPQLG